MEIQNKITTLNTLKAKRTQKLLIYIAYNKPLPAPLPYEEEHLYSQIQGIINKEVQTPRSTKVRILIKIPEIITTKGNKVGPFNEGEVMQVEDPVDVEFIINNKIGELAD